MPPVAPKQPPGTFLPGTKVQVGNQRVVIDRYLSEGGFAHVYVVRLPRDGQTAVLKRVAVPDKEHLAHMRTEVETMKKLKGHHKVVTYMDSHASQLKGGGYEVFLLMEFCSGGGLIDFMNTRLQHRLTEPEILKIFGDVAEGLACMHYLRPPLLHRDLKVENVLISKSNGSVTPTYKLCDFGSAAPPRPAAKTAEEGRLIEEDVQKNTTMQYRSPEMIDVWRRQPIDEKADIWALGVFLYKLCYYTTPFEDVGQMAILNASYKFPSYPSFTPRLRKLISSMLMEDPKARPDIYQVIKEICSMRGTEVPIKDIYTNRTASEATRNESLPFLDSSSSMIGLQKATPQAAIQHIPDIAPMRRGRPAATTQQTPATVNSSSSAAPKGDPFAALDSKNYETRVGAVDELSKRFPSLDEFAIAHDRSEPFQFSSDSAIPSTDEQSITLNDRVAEALADEVFAQTKSKSITPKLSNVSQGQSPTKTAPEKPKPLPKEPITSPTLMHQPTPIRPGNRYKSTGVGSSPPPVAKPKPPPISNRPIWKVPDHHRSSSQPRASIDAEKEAAMLKLGLPSSDRPSLHEIHRSKSQTATLAAAKSPTSSRPSLEGHRPSNLDNNESSSISRAKSAQNRSRPTSMYTNSNMEYLRDQEASSRNNKRPSMEIRRPSRQPSSDRQSPPEEASIENDMEYLRQTSGGHKKRSSLGSLSGAKQMIAGRFGDAFKRFERDDQSALTTPDALDDNVEPALLSPIKGSDSGTSPRRSEDAFNYEETETEDLPPHVKRELERRLLSQEEKRVAEAAAEYRARVATQGASDAAPPSRANTIQQRVQSLLDEGRQAPPPKKTAEGYGRYTATPESLPPGGIATGAQMQQSNVPKSTAPPVARKPPTASLSLNNSNPKPQSPSDIPPANPGAPLRHSTSAPQPSAPTALNPQPSTRPSIPPKSAMLRTGGSAKWPPPPPPGNQPTNLPNTPATIPSEKPRPSGLAALLAKDLEGVPDYPPHGSSLEASTALNEPKVKVLGQKSSAQDDLLGLESEGLVTAGEDGEGYADPEREFSKRFPSLSGFEMA
ncbi:Hypothetical protein R9X50_00420200 [Acrodontium crateriforme]|uniref:non-specific serine/threonine protein kinase n=1 Tax=Acrodontium crateriforme TaxID=150365 RepID=A0AAQ3M4W9_9PEZI|nr:Hypothetical protein R9X50_00420200 [Acrodontium crateriforme]